jgi:hypothetical protein
MHLTSLEGVRISLFYSAGQIYFTGEPCFSMGGTNQFNFTLEEVENWRNGIQPSIPRNQTRRAHKLSGFSFPWQ